MLLISEGELKHALKFAGLSQNKGGFGGDASPVGPLALLEVAVAVDGTVGFRVLVLRERAVHRRP